MDDNKKFVSRLTPVEREHIGAVISQILVHDTASLNIKKLRGYPHIFRVRVGRVRIVYKQDAGEVQIVKVGFRGEDTYKP